MTRTLARFSLLPALLALLLWSLASSGPTGWSQAAGEKLTKGPIIQDVRRDRATLTWVTQRRAGQFQKKGDSTEIPVQEEIYHKAELTRLEPAIRYRYALNEYGADISGSFVTAPASEETPFFFIAFGDTRTRHDVHKRVAEKILQEQPDFVLHTGDLVANGNQPGDWNRFFEIERDLLRNIPFYPALGNHEGNAAVFFQYFSFPGGNGHHYSLDWGSAHFAAIDSNLVGDNTQQKDAFRREQIDWLREDLARNRKPLVFVWFHEPPFTAVAARKESAARLAERVAPILAQGRVAVVFSGHDHNYQHHAHAGIDYVVTGGGGAPLYDLSPTPETLVKGIKAENYVRVRVNRSSARLEAVDLEGKILDSFEVKAR